MVTTLSRLNDERIRVAERLGTPDRVPFGADALGTFRCGLTDVSLKDYYTKPDVMFTVQERWRRLFYDVSPFVVDLGVAVEPSLLGAQVLWRDDEAPLPLPCMERIDDVDTLEVMEVGTAPLIRNAHNIYTYLAEKSGEPVSWHGVLGPVDIACLVRGIREFMLELYTQPEPAKKLLDKATQVCIDVVRHRLKVLDDVPRFMLADDYAGYLHPKLFETIYVPLAQEIYRVLPADVIRWFHSDGDHIGPSVHLIPTTGAQVFHSFTPKLDLADVKQRVGDQLCLSGNIDTIEALQYGTPYDVLNTCRKAIEAAGQNGGYILSSGGELARGTPVENVHAMLLAAAEYGTEVT
jgi:uroporphyrinogen decarboxylase